MRARFLSPAIVVLLILAACGDTASDDPVVTGEGSIPETMPASVPVPPDAVIGATRVDRIENRTSMSLEVPWPLQRVVAFYGVELVTAGYLLDRSAGDDAGWTIRFMSGDLIGEVTLASVDADTTVAELIVNRS